MKLLSNHPTSTRQVTKLSVYGSYLTTGTSLGTPCFEPPTPSPTTSCDAGQKLVPGEGCQNCTVGRVSDPDDPTRWYNFTKRRRSHLANLPIHHITTIAPYHHHRTIPPQHYSAACTAGTGFDVGKEACLSCKPGKAANSLHLEERDGITASYCLDCEVTHIPVVLPF